MVNWLWLEASIGFTSPKDVRVLGCRATGSIRGIDFYGTFEELLLDREVTMTVCESFDNSFRECWALRRLVRTRRPSFWKLSSVQLVSGWQHDSISEGPVQVTAVFSSLS